MTTTRDLLNDLVHEVEELLQDESINAAYYADKRHDLLDEYNQKIEKAKEIEYANK